MAAEVRTSAALSGNRSSRVVRPRDGATKDLEKPGAVPRSARLDGGTLRDGWARRPLDTHDLHVAASLPDGDDDGCRPRRIAGMARDDARHRVAEARRIPRSPG